MTAHVVSVNGLLLLMTVVLSAPVSAAVPRAEAAAGLVPFSGWVGRLPTEADDTWTQRRALAFHRGRLGVWMEAELQTASTRLPVVRQFELRVTLARAARFNGEWDRGRGWITAAGEILARVPAEERTWWRLADYYEEAFALRELNDVRVAYAGVKEFLDGELAPADRFELYRRLVDMAVITGDKENFSRLATALLTTARDWREASPVAPGEVSAADAAMAAYANTLLLRGQAETALGLLDFGIADKTLRQSVTDAAMYARLAQEPEATVTAHLANQSSPRKRLEMLATSDAIAGGIAMWLARLNRGDLVRDMLAGARDELLTPDAGADQTGWEQTWNRSVQRIASEYFQWGRAPEAVRLGELYLEPRTPGSRRRADDAPAFIEDLVRDGRLLDRRDGTVAFAILLGQQGETEAARRLLRALPFDYPELAEVRTNSPGERVMREQAAEAELLQKRIALVSAWAAAGDSERARELMNDLPQDGRLGVDSGDVVRQRLLAEIAAAAAIQGETRVVTQVLADAHLPRPVATQTPTEVTLAFATALVLSGQPGEAWEEVKSAGDKATEVVSDVVNAVLTRGRCNRVLEWVGVAPEEYRGVVWSAFFCVAVPDPAVPPVAPLE